MSELWQAFWTASVWDYIDKISIVAALVGMCFSIAIWLNQKNKEKQDNVLIDIRLHCPEPETTVTLQGQIRRKNLTRAEVQGLLGILPMKDKGKRYALPALNQRAFFEALEQAQVDSKIDVLVIECTAEELQQFDLNILS